MNARKILIHSAHCCVMHGCKYGDEDCPVVSLNIEQSYPCEECYEFACEYSGDFIVTAKDAVLGVPTNHTVLKSHAEKEKFYRQVFMYRSMGYEVEVQAVATVFNSKNRE